MADVIDLPPPDERGPWGAAVLDCRACGHTQVSTAPMAAFASGQPFECGACHEMAADVPWAARDLTCPCGHAFRIRLWEPVDIMPVRWPCPGCGAAVDLTAR